MTFRVEKIHKRWDIIIAYDVMRRSFAKLSLIYWVEIIQLVLRLGSMD